jgi:hypothetical protein
MGPESNPQVSARSLRGQVEGALDALAPEKPGLILRGRFLGSMLRTLTQVLDEYGPRLHAAAEIMELLIAQAPRELPDVSPANEEPITVRQMRAVLESVKHTLMDEEETEARRGYGSTASTEGSHWPIEPGGTANWQVEPGGKGYRAVGGHQQHRRTAVHRPGGSPQ